MKIWERKNNEEALEGRMWFILLAFIIAMITGNFSFVLGGLVLALVDETIYNATHRV